MGCQLNGASTQETRDVKSFQISQLVNQYGMQGVDIEEHGTNFSGVHSSAGMQSWFNEKQMVKTNAAWNKHEGPTEGNGFHLQ